MSFSRVNQEKMEYLAEMVSQEKMENLDFQERWYLSFSNIRHKYFFQPTET